VVRRWPLVLAGVVLGLVALAVVAAFFIDEPLRRSMEREANRRLDGYTVSIGALDFHPFGFSIDFHDLVVRQDAHPEPPVLHVPRLTASVQWRQLLRAALVADFALDRPAVHVDLDHLRQEARDEVPVDQRGWQEALQALYPLKINQFRVRDGTLTYVETARARPLTLSRIELVAGNIRNIHSRDRVYPSILWMEAAVFERGRVEIDGNADFLATPHPGVLAKLRLDDIDLDHFRPVAARWNVRIRKGVLAATGNVEYGPTIGAVHVEDAVIHGAEIDYVHTPAAARPAQAARATADKAAEAANRPDLQLRVDRLRAAGGVFGFVNQGAKPAYRVFLADTRLDLRNLSNHFTDGTATAELAGKFMGTGQTAVKAAFRPEVKGPDFDLSVRLVDTDMRAMNDLLRAHGNFDVVGGLFSFYSELRVRDRQIEGYVKPLFRNLDVYDRRQDREKSAFRKLYERLVEGVAGLLENRPRKEIATVAEVEGPVEDPQASTWEIVVRLVQNAFFRAILPGFEQEIGRRR
jgi:hypothetical protein